MGSWVNIVGLAVWFNYVLVQARDTLDITDVLATKEYHAMATLLVIIPQGTLETAQYVKTNQVTDLIGVIVLMIDVGIRLKTVGSYFAHGSITVQHQLQRS